MEPDPRTERLRRAVVNAIEKKQERLDAELLDRKGLPRPGDIFAPQRSGGLIDWTVIQTHPDDDRLLFVVPADDYPLYGTSDVVVPDYVSCAPLTLRCGQGTWARSDYFTESKRVGVLDEPTLRAARRKLADMVRGRVEGTAAARENEADPDYEEWIERVRAMRAALESSLERHGLVLSLDEFRPGQPMNIPCDDPTLGERSYGPLKHATEGPGDLYLVADSKGVRGLWTGEAKPPQIRTIGDAGRPRRAKWSPTTEASDCESTPLFPWLKGRVELRIGPGKGHRVAIEGSAHLTTPALDWTRLGEVIAIRLLSDDAAAGRIAMAMAAAGSVPERGSILPMSAARRGRNPSARVLSANEPVYFDLPEVAIRATLRLTASEKLEVSFETSEPGYMGWRVDFSFREPIGDRVIRTADVTLEPKTGGEAGWEGIRVCAATFDVPFVVWVRVRPAGGD